MNQGLMFSRRSGYLYVRIPLRGRWLVIRWWTTKAVKS